MEQQRELAASQAQEYNQRLDQRVTSNMFRWVIGLIISGLVAIGATATSTKMDVLAVQEDVQDIKQTLAAGQPKMDSRKKQNIFKEDVIKK